MIRSGELTKATPAEVAEYLKRYNELDGEEGEEGGRKKDGDNRMGGEGNSGTVSDSFTRAGGEGVELGDKYRNSEGRGSDAAPVASAGSSVRRQHGVQQAS